MAAANPYDEIPYPNNPLTVSHPGRLATLAMLHGLKPAPPTRCRVLELGCGAGGNLAPMAMTLPDSEFVGIDLARRPIECGLEMVAACGLTNMTLHQRDIREVGAEFGSFDYIIAHGIYSWVPADVRDRLLGICGSNLTPQGVAFVSLSVYPGAFYRRMAREMVRHHARHAAGPQEQVAKARELLDFLAGAMAQPEGYRAVLKEEQSILENFGDDYYLHETLSEIHDPVWFHEFAAHAGRHGLQYVSDTAHRCMEHVVPAEAIERLREFGGGQRLEREQYRDFLECRQFRRTLLCRQDALVADEPDPEQVRQLFAASPAKPVSARPDLLSAAVETFANAGGVSVGTNDPLIKAAMCVLGERWPRPLAFAELLEQARARIGRPDDPDDPQVRKLAEFLVTADAVQLARLHAHVPLWAETVSARPLASPLVRWQINEGRPVTNVWHHNIEMEEPMLRRLLALLDGTRGRAELVRELIGFMKSKGIVLQMQGRPVTDRARLSRLLAGALDDNLAKFAENCLLIG